jgi:hypothetical protein
LLSLPWQEQQDSDQVLELEAEVERLQEELETAENDGYKLGWQQAMEAEHPPEEVTPTQTDP